MKLGWYLHAKERFAKGDRKPPTTLSVAFEKAAQDFAKEAGETGHLLSNDKNAERLRASIAQLNGQLEVSQAGIDLLHKFEGCAIMRADGFVESYPDPGSKDGHPWTIGWGSTGYAIGPGTVWTQKQCDERFEKDLRKYAAEVRQAIGDTPTTQNQFDALVSFHYNTGAIFTATLTKLHKRGLYEEAAKQFSRWVFNDGKKMRGLERRREAERELYQT